ncbi:MAG: hypothetical protein R6X31_13920 [Anaerolineae bacterium]
MNGSEEPREPSVVSILLRLMAYVLILAAILLASAGRLDWVMGWIYMAPYACVTVFGVLVVPLDPGLIEERTRINEGTKEWDKRISVVGRALYPSAQAQAGGHDHRGVGPR